MSEKNPELNKDCPECKSRRIVEGSVLSQPDYFYPGAYFRPKELRPFVLTGINIRFKNLFCSCLDCGCIWSKINKEKLIEVIASKGNKVVKDRVGLT